MPFPPYSMHIFAPILSRKETARKWKIEKEGYFLPQRPQNDHVGEWDPGEFKDQGHDAQHGHAEIEEVPKGGKILHSPEA